MKTIKELRIDNFNAIAAKYASLNDLATILGKPPALLSQIRSGDSFGDKLARDIEVKLDLPIGWFDNDHEETTSVSKALALIKNEIERNHISDEERKLLLNFRKLNEKEKSLLIGMAQSLMTRSS